jgi:hypothetical protein
VPQASPAEARPSTWARLFERDQNQLKVTWYCSPRQVIAAAALSRNLSPNLLDSQSLRPVLELLRQTPVLEGHPPVGSPSVILRENPTARVVALTHMAPSLIMRHSGVAMTIPAEGTVQYQLGWVIPEHSIHAPTARDLLSILRKPEVLARFAPLSRMSPATSAEAAQILRQRHPRVPAVNLPLTRTYYLLDPWTPGSPAFEEALQLVKDRVNSKHAPAINPLEPPPADSAQQITLEPEQASLPRIAEQSQSPPDPENGPETTADAEPNDPEEPSRPETRPAEETQRDPDSQ